MKKNKCKKILIFTTIIYALLIQKIFAYNVKITKENLTEAFNSYSKNYQKIQVTETQLIDSTDEENIEYIDYNIKNIPTFSIKQEINAQTDLEKINDISDKLREPLIGIVGVAIAQGMSDENAFDYYISDVGMYLSAFKEESFMMISSESKVTIQVGEESKTFNKDKFDVSEVIKLLFGEEKQIIKKDAKGIYTYTINITQMSVDNYNVEAKVEINKDADFSKIAPLNSNNTNVNNSESNKKDDNDINKSNENVNSVKSDTSNSTVNNSNVQTKQTNNDNNVNQTIKKELPKTGDNTITLGVFIIAIVVCSIIIKIKLNRYKDF